MMRTSGHAPGFVMLASEQRIELLGGGMSCLLWILKSLMGEEEYVHPFQYFVDCVSECKKAGEMTEKLANSILTFKVWSNEPITSSVPWLPSADLEAHTILTKDQCCWDLGL